MQFGFFRDPARREPAQLLADWPSLVDIAEAAACGDVRVSVVQTSERAARIERNSIVYHFVAPGHGNEVLADTPQFARLIADLAPDLCHVHGFGFPADVQALARLDGRRPILLQHHADAVPRFWRRRECRRGLALAAGLAFTGSEQSARFAAVGLIRAGTRIFDIPESTSRLVSGDRAAARRVSGLAGDPCILWVGHLNANKDPLAVLEGVRLAAAQFPDLRLWCCFATAPLLASVENRIASDPVLRERVKLLGRVPHASMETLMQAADVYVSGSHCEGSGYSLIEAMACGLPVAVTDIPPFRALLAGNQASALWAVGDPDALRRALLTLLACPREALRQAALAHFERELSFAALGRKWAAAYRALTEHAYAST